MNEEQNKTDQREEQAPQHAQQPDESERTAEMITKILAITGLIAILALAAWISVQVIRLAPSAGSAVSDGVQSALVTLSSVFQGDDAPEESGDLTIGASHVRAQSGDEVRLTWGQDVLPEATYTLTVACSDTVEVALVQNGTELPHECGEAVALGTTTAISAVPTLQANGSADIELSIAALSSEEIVTEKAVTLSVSGGELASGEPSTPGQGGANGANETPAQPARPAPSTQQPAQTVTSHFTYERPISDPNGRSDLSVHVIATGLQLSVDGEERFVPSQTIPSDKVAAIRFSVENVGTRTSEPFSFTATLPVETEDDFVYEASESRELRPGDRIEYMLAFDRVARAESGLITIELDPEGDEANRLNNTAVSIIEIEER